MKTKLLNFISVLVVSIAPNVFVNPLHAQPGAEVSMQIFYDNLSPHGKWMEDAKQGYFWIPNLDDSFRPYYSNGHWVMTQYGTMWVSAYSWGWAPFHYGRWIYDTFYKWIWLPGSQWAPAWVIWRSNGDYYGWTPLTPTLSISAALSPSYYVPDNWWTFIPGEHLFNPEFQLYNIDPERNSTFISQTSVMKSTEVMDGETYITGPKTNAVTRASASEATLYFINDAAIPGIPTTVKNELTIYRPKVTKPEIGSGARPAHATTTVMGIGKASPLVVSKRIAQAETPPPAVTQTTGNKKTSPAKKRSTRAK